MSIQFLIDSFFFGALTPTLTLPLKEGGNPTPSHLSSGEVAEGLPGEGRDGGRNRQLFIESSIIAPTLPPRPRNAGRAHLPLKTCAFAIEKESVR